MGHDVIRVALAKPGALKEVHHVRFAGTLLVQAILVLLETDRPAKDDLVATSRETVVRVVENDLN